MSATGELIEVSVPDIGDFGDVPVIELLVSVGDVVAPEDPLVTLESDKATMDVPSPAAGIVRALHVSVGDRVSEGSRLLDLAPGDPEEPSPPAEPAAAAGTEQAAAATVDSPATPPPAPDAHGRDLPAPENRELSAPDGASSNGGGPVYASPSARRLARELGVDLASVSGTGRKGRITLDDVRAAGDRGAATGSGERAAFSPGVGVEGLGLAPWPQVDFGRFGPVERVPLSRIQRISAPNLARNWVLIPHVTQHDEADITDLESWRRELNQELAGEAKVTMVSFLIVASVAALKEFPKFNSALDGDELVLRRYYNIGFAADTPGGLVVPVIRDADHKGLVQIAQELTELSVRAREGKLSPADMSGGTFTISSLGGIGGTSFTPIINAPEVAILGATRAAMRPVWNGSELVPRLMLPLSLSYDHRVIDGADAARFVVHLTRVLGDLRRVLL